MMRLRPVIFLFLCAISLVCVADDNNKSNKNHNYAVARNLESFSAIYKNLDMMYVDTLDADVTIGAGIKAMLRSLDPYTEYYAGEDVKNLKQMLTGKYAGIGSLIRKDMRTGYIAIDEPYANMPASEVGLRKGDIIISIDDSVMIGKDVSYVSSHLRGEPGTTFLLKVLRPTEEMLDNTELEKSVVSKALPSMPKSKTSNKGKGVNGNDKSILTFKVTRRAIQLPCVPYYGMIDDEIGYLELTQFTEDCARDVRRGLVDMRQKGMKKLIFDLRNNGGGSLQEAIKIVNMFVPKGLTIVTTKGKIQRTNSSYKTEQEPLDTVMPVVVLVNDNTASASEITAGSLQDLDRATIMGERTFGKGLVQQTITLPHDGEMKLTVSKYYIPSGRCIQAINYKHTGGGYTEHIPDSLTHVFYTKKGREVRDGGGIKPDIEVKADSIPNIALYLSGGGLDSTSVFDRYVEKYVIRHQTIAPAKEFHLTDAEYGDFKKMVIESGFKYDRETSKVYDTLVKMAKFEGYYDDAKPEFEALKKKLQHNLERELDNNRTVIQHLLEDDIIACYYYQRGAIEAALKSDNQVKAAETYLVTCKK